MYVPASQPASQDPSILLHPPRGFDVIQTQVPHNTNNSATDRWEDVKEKTAHLPTSSGVAMSEAAAEAILSRVGDPRASWTSTQLRDGKGKGRGLQEPETVQEDVSRPVPHV